MRSSILAPPRKLHELRQLGGNVIGVDYLPLAFKAAGSQIHAVARETVCHFNSR
jgi:hypothetical protein